MDPQRQRIRDDLRGVVLGDVLCDDIATTLYASDGSLFQVRPLAVVRPRSTDDVAAVMRYADDQNLPIHARGAGTGLAGESLGQGVMIDFSRYMRRVLETRDDAVRVQPGVVHARLNEQLRPLNRLFGPDPAMSQVTTMGSVIAIDNSGSHWPLYGSARSQTLSLEIVLADGTVMEVGRERLRRPSLDEDPHAAQRAVLAGDVAELCSEHRDLILAKKPRTLVNRSGYDLATTYDGETLDLAKLICGSEGTLGLITAATVAIQPLPKFKVAAILMFASLEHAVQAVPLLMAYGPCALDMLDRRHLSLAVEHDPRFEPIVSRDTEALLLIEFSGDNLRAEQDKVRAAVDDVTKLHRLAFDARIASDMDELRLFWRLARRVTPTLQRAGGAARPVPFVEDVAIPPETLGDFLGRLQRVLKSHQVTASFYGHVGHGQLHIRPFLDMNSPADTAKLDALAGDLYDETLAVGGTISGEHGDGLSRTPFVRRQYGELCDVFAQVKRLFDPKGLLNPGKILAERADERVSLTAFLRPGGATVVPSPARGRERERRSDRGRGERPAAARR
ncbi:MAG: FAD-binding oxidoreductase [Pirellulales bacterium]